MFFGLKGLFLINWLLIDLKYNSFMKNFYIYIKALTIIIILIINGCTNEPSLLQKHKDVHNHIQSNKQEAKQAQKEYSQIKKQRTNI